MRGKLVSILGISIIVLPIFLANIRGVEMSLSWFVVLCLIIGITVLIIGIVLEVKNKKRDQKNRD